MRRGGSATLARMRLVDQDGKAPAVAVLVADLIEDKRELLHRADDDLLAALNELAQIAECSACPTVAPTVRIA
jgi:hypothetical protein